MTARRPSTGSSSTGWRNTCAAMASPSISSTTPSTDWSGGNGHPERLTAAIGLKKLIETDLGKTFAEHGEDCYDRVYTSSGTATAAPSPASP